MPSYQCRECCYKGSRKCDLKNHIKRTHKRDAIEDELEPLPEKKEEERVNEIDRKSNITYNIYRNGHGKNIENIQNNNDCYQNIIYNIFINSFKNTIINNQRENNNQQNTIYNIFNKSGENDIDNENFYNNYAKNSINNDLSEINNHYKKIDDFGEMDVMYILHSDLENAKTKDEITKVLERKNLLENIAILQKDIFDILYETIDEIWNCEYSEKRDRDIIIKMELVNRKIPSLSDNINEYLKIK